VPDWDEDSPQLRDNLTKILEEVATQADRRDIPSLETARRWQSLVMQGLEVPQSVFVGAFRGEPGLEEIQVRVGINYGVDSAEVAVALNQFEAKLQLVLVDLDNTIPMGLEPGEDQQNAVVDVCAWAHAEWVRIHPFANGNGPTARIWANFIALRYNLPPFVRLRPRPNDGYGEAGFQAMRGDWKPTVAVFRKLLDMFLDEDRAQPSDSNEASPQTAE
jgi:hypothetical protein